VQRHIIIINFYLIHCVINCINCNSIARLYSLNRSNYLYSFVFILKYIVNLSCYNCTFLSRFSLSIFIYNCFIPKTITVYTINTIIIPKDDYCIYISIFCAFLIVFLYDFNITYISSCVSKIYFSIFKPKM